MPDEPDDIERFEPLDLIGTLNRHAVRFHSLEFSVTPAKSKQLI
jgi:hypothetical protein